MLIAPAGTTARKVPVEFAVGIDELLLLRNDVDQCSHNSIPSQRTPITAL
jgi:hypothetical protein